MAKRIFDTETWIKLGQPDLNSKMYYIVNGKKVWGQVIAINYGHKKGVELTIRRFKK
jgi:hypothetical protein